MYAHLLNDAFILLGCLLVATLIAFIPAFLEYRRGLSERPQDDNLGKNLQHPNVDDEPKRSLEEPLATTDQLDSESMMHTSMLEGGLGVPAGPQSIELAQYITALLKHERKKCDEKIKLIESKLDDSRTELRRANEELAWLTRELQIARDSAVHAARTKCEFLSNMSHEIRTPLNGLIATSELLLSTELNEEQRDYLQISQQSATTLLETVNDLLDFTRIENDNLTLDVMDFDILTLVEGAAQLVSQNALTKHLSLMTYVANEVPLTLYGDPTRVRQILINLLSNAIKFTEHGEVVCRVSLESITSARATVKFVVKDTGSGISKSVAAELFEPFVQLDGSSTRANCGTGLGLSIAKKLVELMGGELGVDSEEGTGATFWFTLPFEYRADSRTPAKRSNMTVVRMLVIDGLAGSQQVVVDYAKSWGMTCATADKGAQGIECLSDSHLRGKPFDIVVVDHDVSDIDAFKLGRHIQNLSEFKHTGLILLCASQDQDILASALSSGYAACLTKPIKQSQLFDCITHVLDSRSQPTVLEQPLQTGAPAESAGAETKSEGPIVLVVEDNSINQRIARLQLQELGCRVHVVNNGREAMYATMRTCYDIVLMDCAMPLMDGYEATRKIRKQDALSGRHTIIVALTAHAMQGDREKCLSSGMDDYLSKPVSADQLREVLQRWVPNRVTKL